MAISRSAIFAKLWDLLQGVPGVVTFGQTIKLWSDVDPSAQPALFLVTGGQTAAQNRGLPPKWTLKAELYVYVNSRTSQDATPGARLNMILDAIEAALEPLAPLGPEGSVQTLSKAVWHCWIAGIETDEGALGEQSVAVVHLEMLAA